MKYSNWLLVLVGFFPAVGCQETIEPVSTKPSTEISLSGETPDAVNVPAETVAASEPATDKPAETAATGDAAGNSIALTEANTKVEFVGVHVGDKPDPRTGSFGELAGSATVDGGTLTSLSVEFVTDSLTTNIEALTVHLKAPEFFDVKEHPTAKFVSTAIAPGDDGKVNITGDLTLLGTTKSITFPATVTTDGGLKLSATLSIDRTEFGMTYSEDKVEKMVSLTVSIGG